MGRVITLYKKEKWTYEVAGTLQSNANIILLLVTVGELDDCGITPLRKVLLKEVYDKILSNKFKINDDRYSEEIFEIEDRNGRLIDASTGDIIPRDKISTDKICMIVNDASRLSFREVFPDLNLLLKEVGYGGKKVNTLIASSKVNPRTLTLTAVRDDKKFKLQFNVFRDKIEVFTVLDDESIKHIKNFY